MSQTKSSTPTSTEEEESTSQLIIQLTSSLQARGMEIEELEKRLRHNEFTSSQEINRLNTLLEAEKQRATVLEQSLKEIRSQQSFGLEDDSLKKLKEENQTLLAQKLEAEKKLKDVEALVMDALKEKDTHIKDKEAHIESLKEHITTTKNIFKKQMEFCSEELKRLEAENLELKKKSSSFVGEEDLLHQIANLEEHCRVLEKEKYMQNEQLQNVLAKLEETTLIYEDQIKQLNAELEEKGAERDRLYEQIIGTKDIKRELITEIEKAEERLKISERHHHEQIREHEKREKQLEMELKETQRHLKEKTAAYEEINLAVLKAKELEKELQAHKEGANLKIKNLEEQIKRLDAARESELTLACNLETEQKKLTAELKNQLEKVKKYEADLMELHLSSTEKEKSLMTRLEEAEKAHLKEKDELENQMARMKIEQTKLFSPSKMDDLKENETRSRKASIAENGNEQNALAQELEEVYYLTRASTADAEHMERLEGEVKRLQSELKELKEQKAESHENEKTKAMMAEQNKKIMALMEEIDNLRIENIKTQSTLKCIEMQKENEIKYWEKETEILDKAVANAKVTIAQLTLEKEHVESKYRSLLKKKGGKK